MAVRSGWRFRRRGLGHKGEKAIASIPRLRGTKHRWRGPFGWLRFQCIRAVSKECQTVWIRPQSSNPLSQLPKPRTLEKCLPFLKVIPPRRKERAADHRRPSAACPRPRSQVKRGIGRRQTPSARVGSWSPEGPPQGRSRRPATLWAQICGESSG